VKGQPTDVALKQGSVLPYVAENQSDTVDVNSDTSEESTILETIDDRDAAAFELGQYPGREPQQR